MPGIRSSGTTWMGAIGRTLRNFRSRGFDPPACDAIRPCESAAAEARPPACGDHPRVSRGHESSRERPERSRELSILIAEDNRFVGEILARLLWNAGYETRIVGSGQAVTEAFARQPCDAILLDVDMPESDSIETAKIIRAMPAGAKVPIIALCGRALEGAEQRCQDAGIDAALAKPPAPDDVIELVAKLATPHRKQSPACEPSAPRASPAGEPCQPADAAVDARTLESLRQLGGEAFVRELTDQFLEDAATTVEALRSAVDAGDANAFRGHAHAIRSGAANIGARGIYQMCLAWRGIGEAELAAAGAGYLGKLERELERVRNALRTGS